MNTQVPKNENILIDFGFSPNFFNHIENTVYTIEKNPMRKVSSANAVLAIPVEEQINQKKCLEAEDKELYEEDNWSKQEASISEGSTNSGYGKLMSNYSNEQMIHLANISGLRSSSNKMTFCFLPKRDFLFFIPITKNLLILPSLFAFLA